MKVQATFMTLSIFCTMFLSFLVTVYSLSSASMTINPRDTATFMTKENKIAYDNENEKLHAFIKSSVPEMLKHTGALAFDDHLKGVQAVMHYWDQPKYLCNAGLVHSIYGTQGFQGFKLPYSSREQVRDLVGEKAERLAFIFCVIDRELWDNLVETYHTRLMKLVEEADGKDIDFTTFEEMDYAVKSRLELGHFDIKFHNEREFLDFVTLTLGDWLEQVEGAATKENPLFEWEAGQAYGHRRVAFGKHKDILVHRLGMQKAKEFYEEVMATESEENKTYHQPITPDMTDAAKEARLAYMSYNELCN